MCIRDRGNRHNEKCCFELFFRKCPFENGKFAVFGGLDEVVRFLKGYKFTNDHISFLRGLMP